MRIFCVAKSVANLEGLLCQTNAYLQALPMAFAGKCQIPGPGAGCGRKQLARTNVSGVPLCRTSCRVHATQVEQAAPSISWFTQPERFVSIQHPSRDAKLLERAFWHHPVVDVPSTREEAVVMIEGLQRETEAHGLANGTNVVAFTGGNGPALTAYLLDSIFDGAVAGCVGDESLVSAEQREHAAYVCDLLGLELLEVDDNTWRKFSGQDAQLCSSPVSDSVALFSGYTADESSQHSNGNVVCSPLSRLSHAAVNALSRVVGLPTTFRMA